MEEVPVTAYLRLGVRPVDFPDQEALGDLLEIAERAGATDSRRPGCHVAALRRVAARGRAGPGQLEVVVDTTVYSVAVGGRVLDFGRTQGFRLLAELARRPNQPVNTDALINAVWPSCEAENNTLHKAVSQLRQQLKAVGLPLAVEAKRNNYRLLVLDGLKLSVVW